VDLDLGWLLQPLQALLKLTAPSGDGRGATGEDED